MSPIEGRSGTVCVVIPTRNRPKLLRAALESVLEQDIAELEVIIVDEGSSPPADEALGNLDRRVRLLRNEAPKGPAAARNQGAAASNATYIAFLDDDDRWLPGKLQSCLGCLERHPEAGMVFHRAVVGVTPKAGTGECRFVDDPVRRMLVQQPPHLDSVIVRRHIHEQVLFDESFEAAEDLDYLLRLADVAPVVELDQVLAVHGSPPGKPSEIGMDERIAGRKQLWAKHASRFEDPEVRAFYYVRLGHLHRIAGHRLQATRCFARALRFRPDSILAWKGLIRSLVAGGKPGERG